jgi:hypothetical protein
VKLKRQATAAFLGVFSFPQDVVGGCCIPTTIFEWDLAPREANLRITKRPPSMGGIEVTEDTIR